MGFSEYKKRTKVLCWVLFALYLVVLVYVLFFADILGRTDTTQTFEANLTLFQEIKRFWTYRHQLGFPAVFLNLAGNILVFLPFGFLLPIMSKKLRGFCRIICLGLVLSLAVECIQLVTKTGCFDVDDLLLNVIGSALGFLLFAIMQRRRNKKSRRGRPGKRQRR